MIWTGEEILCTDRDCGLCRGFSFLFLLFALECLYGTIESGFVIVCKNDFVSSDRSGLPQIEPNYFLCSYKGRGFDNSSPVRFIRIPADI